jgi:hypothetical protein
MEITVPLWMQRLVLSLAVGASLVLGNGGTISVAHGAEPSPTDAAAPIADGIYAFGESQQRDTLGSTYLVLRVQGTQVVGGFYQPSSSYDCFQGEIDGNTLALNILDSYEQTSYPYELALESTTQVASYAGIVIEALVPSGFYLLPDLSSTDQMVLSSCQARF